MPRRVVDYTEAYAFWNMVSSIGAFISGVGTILFVYLIYDAFKAKRLAAANPWGPGATTLEWTAAVPAAVPHLGRRRRTFFGDEDAMRRPLWGMGARRDRFRRSRRPTVSVGGRAARNNRLIGVGGVAFWR